MLLDGLMRKTFMGLEIALGVYLADKLNSSTRIL